MSSPQERSHRPATHHLAALMTMPESPAPTNSSSRHATERSATKSHRRHRKAAHRHFDFSDESLDLILGGSRTRSVSHDGSSNNDMMMIDSIPSVKNGNEPFGSPPSFADGSFMDESN